MIFRSRGNSFLDNEISDIIAQSQHLRKGLLWMYELAIYRERPE